MRYFASVLFAITVIVVGLKIAVDHCSNVYSVGP